MENGKLMWWQERIAYQIYPMSFCDADGDGIGDIRGIIGKLDYLASLGVGILWLSPIYPSPNEDNGYDIADHTGVQPAFGVMADVEELLEEAHKRDLKVILDLVANHTSKEHEWFQKSRKRIEPYSGYYFWTDKPNNWTGFFGGKAWEFDPERGQSYLHLFAKGQPDLDYHNPLVVEEMEKVMRFWLDKGADGFRCDVVNILWKEDLGNGRWKPALVGSEKYISTEGVHALLRKFNRDVFSRYDCFTVGETVFVTPKMARDLTDPGRGELDAAFSFEHMESDCFFVKWFLRKFSPTRFFRILSKWQKALPWNTLYLENHDQSRSVSRFADDGRFHSQSAKTLAVLLLSLRGTPFIYQGEEIGMTNADLAGMDEVRDVESINIWNLGRKLLIPRRLRWKMVRTKGRDNARTPMQWSAARNGGFTDGVPWLKVNSNHKTINVASQERDADSVLNFYRRMAAFRNGSAVLLRGAYRELLARRGVFAFERALDGGRLVVVVNLSGRRRPAPFAGVCLVSTEGRARLEGEMEPYEAAVLADAVETSRSQRAGSTAGLSARRGPACRPPETGRQP